MTRPLLVALLLIVSLAVAATAGIIAADWPAWQKLIHSVQHYGA